jgi:diguanylate cyclase (GGDEF)-like protein
MIVTHSREFYSTLLRQIQNTGIYVLDRECRIIFAEGDLLARHGKTSKDLERAFLASVVVADNLPLYEKHIARAFVGHCATFDVVRDSINYEVRVGPMFENDRVQWALLTTHDISQRKSDEAQLRQLLHTDTVTKLSNRAHFDRALRDISQSQEPAALIYLDLDDFKLINDAQGHAAGDDCLREVARCLRFATRGRRDISARLGGDEFGVLLPDTDKHAAYIVLRRITHALEAANIQASMGIAAYPSQATTGVALLRAADAAMYDAKRAKKGSLRPKGESK